MKAWRGLKSLITLLAYSSSPLLRLAAKGGVDVLHHFDLGSNCLGIGLVGVLAQVQGYTMETVASCTMWRYLRLSESVLIVETIVMATTAKMTMLRVTMIMRVMAIPEGPSSPCNSVVRSTVGDSSDDDDHDDDQISAFMEPNSGNSWLRLPRLTCRVSRRPEMLEMPTMVGFSNYRFRV